MLECLYMLVYNVDVYLYVYIYMCIHYKGMLYTLFAPLINITFDISTSHNIKISNIYAKIAGNRCQTSGKYLPTLVGLRNTLLGLI